ncbi:YbaB/EbfC family nucleoid-associated protein [Nocardia sp. NBC_00416]|uniref:YbaB/EbfC family nucleoid-associated protein n=1 Tax=Nocardia sp. NBC_00416 TaxID=2975991 RepID=UPI002E22EF98
MANEMMKEQLAALVDSFRSDLRTLRQVQQQRAGLSASASAGGGRITVTVDADGVPADVEFTADISTLGYPEIARGVLSAAREAALEVRRQSAGLVQSVHDPQDLPKLSDFLPGVPDLSALIPGPPQDLLPPPGKPAASDDEGLVFTDVVELPPTPDPGVRDTGWHSDPPVDPEPGSIDRYDDSEQAVATPDSEVADRGW